MTLRIRGLAACVTVLLATAGCSQSVSRYTVSPAKGQSAQQMDNDKFECNLQAQQQTGFNPDRTMTQGALIGAMAGAGAGAAIGAAAGAVTAGTIAGASVGATVAAPYLVDRSLNETQRAYLACLEARGYTLTR